MAGGVGLDVATVRSCTCLRLRRSAREVTQHYDAHLAPAGVTIGQFGLLALLYGAQVDAPGLSLKSMARSIGMDPTTLHRNLKPLQVSGWIENATDPRDRRARLLSLTEAGREVLAAATPCWQEAEAALSACVGHETLVALNGLLHLAGAKLQGR